MRQAWMKLAVFYWLDPKFAGLGPVHQALYTRLLGYTVAYNTAGSIPANAIALCGRGIRNRDRLVADLVTAGLLVTTDGALAFPQAWHQWNNNRDVYAQQTAGQGRSPVRAGEEKRREEKKSLKEPSLLDTRAVIDGMTLRHDGTQWVESND